MAGEKYTYTSQELKKETGGRIKRAALWATEKSTYITFPIAGVIFVAGAATGAPALMVAGGAGMGIDIVQNRVAKKWRQKDTQQGNAEQPKSALARMKDIFIPKRNPTVRTA